MPMIFSNRVCGVRFQLMGRASASLLLAALALSAVSGCGGSDDAEGEINDVLDRTFTTSDPAQCEELSDKAIQKLLPSSSGAEDPVAVCKENLDPSTEADSIEVTDLTVDGTDATATVTPQGGSYAGASVDVKLLDDDGWKIDELGEIEIVDRDAYVDSLDQSLEASAFGANTLRPRDLSCVSGYVRNKVSTADLQRSLTTGDRTYLYNAVRDCLGGGLDFIAVVQLIDNQLVAEGIEPKKARCLAGLSLAGLKDATVEQYAEDPAVKARIEKDLRKSGAFLCSPESGN
jgi:hypothetical protein